MLPKLGETASITKKITLESIKTFAETVGDFNPLHFDDEFAKNEGFDERIAHGMLVGSLVSIVLGTKQGAQDVPQRRINCRYVQLVKDVPHRSPSLKVENVPHPLHRFISMGLDFGDIFWGNINAEAWRKGF